jgi:hypothetical protein
MAVGCKWGHDLWFHDSMLLQISEDHQGTNSLGERWWQAAQHLFTLQAIRHKEAEPPALSTLNGLLTRTNVDATDLGSTSTYKAHGNLAKSRASQTPWYQHKLSPCSCYVALSPNFCCTPARLADLKPCKTCKLRSETTPDKQDTHAVV